MQAIEVKPLYIDTAIVINNIAVQQPIQQPIQQQLPIKKQRMPDDRLLTLAYVAKHIKFIQYRKVYVPRF